MSIYTETTPRSFDGWYYAAHYYLFEDRAPSVVKTRNPHRLNDWIQQDYLNRNVLEREADEAITVQVEVLVPTAPYLVQACQEGDQN